MLDSLMQYVPSFLLVFCRITSFFMAAPIFSTRSIPMPFKIGLCFFVTLLTFITVMGDDLHTWHALYPLLIIREILVGILLGFVAYLFFTVVQVAGSFVDIQMGFGIANVVDPLTGTQSPVLGNIKFVIAVLLFLAVNGHHYFMMGIMQSYELVPLNNELFAIIYSGAVSEFLVRAFAMMFMLAMQLAAPLIATLFLVDLALGMLARTAPQFNIFVVGLPIKILVGMIILFVLVPGFLYLFTNLFESMLEAMQHILLLIGQGGAADAQS